MSVSKVPPSDSGFNSEAEIVLGEEDSTIPNGLVLSAGTNTTVDTSTPGQIKVNASGGSDISDLTFLTKNNETGDASNSIRLAEGKQIALDYSVANILTLSASGILDQHYDLIGSTSLTSSNLDDYQIYTLSSNSTINLPTTADCIGKYVIFIALGSSILNAGSGGVINDTQTLVINSDNTASNTVWLYCVDTKVWHTIGQNLFYNNATRPAPSDGSYITANGVVGGSQWRQLVAGDGLSSVDGGAESSFTIINTAPGFLKYASNQGAVMAGTYYIESGGVNSYEMQQLTNQGILVRAITVTAQVAPGGSDTDTFTFRVDGSDTAITVDLVGAATSAVGDFTGSEIAVPAGSLISLGLVKESNTSAGFVVTIEYYGPTPA